MSDLIFQVLGQPFRVPHCSGGNSIGYCYHPACALSGSMPTCPAIGVPTKGHETTLAQGATKRARRASDDGNQSSG